MRSGMDNSDPDQIAVISESSISNYNLLLPYFAPYMVFVGIISFGSALPAGWKYGLSIMVVSILLLWFRRKYVSLTGPMSSTISVFWGVLVGILGTVIWVSMRLPFVEPGADGWSPVAFFLRLFAASMLVPVFEEILMRGYVFRLAYQWDSARKRKNDRPLYSALHDQNINNVEQGAWSTPAIIISTIAFTAGHNLEEWPAAFIYGLLMAFLWIKRKDLISCIAAHATTNFTLGLYVYFTKQWGLW
jgi:membrane protease YdiL (CAAX protease family)